MVGEWLARLASGWRVVGEWLASGWQGGWRVVGKVVGEWLASGWQGGWQGGWGSGLGLTVVVYGSPSCFINLPIVF